MWRCGDVAMGENAFRPRPTHSCKPAADAEAAEQPLTLGRLVREYSTLWHTRRRAGPILGVSRPAAGREPNRAGHLSVLPLPQARTRCSGSASEPP